MHCNDRMWCKVMIWNVWENLWHARNQSDKQPPSPPHHGQNCWSDWFTKMDKIGRLFADLTDWEEVLNIYQWMVVFLGCHIWLSGRDGGEQQSTVFPSLWFVCGSQIIFARWHNTQHTMTLFMIHDNNLLLPLWEWWHYGTDEQANYWNNIFCRYYVLIGRSWSETMSRNQSLCSSPPLSQNRTLFTTFRHSIVSPFPNIVSPLPEINSLRTARLLGGGEKIVARKELGERTERVEERDCEVAMMTRESRG